MKRLTLVCSLLCAMLLTTQSWATSLLATCTPANDNVNDTSFDITCTSTTPGSFVALYVTFEGAATNVTVTGDGSAMSERPIRDHTAGDLHSQWFYRESSPGGTTTFTVTFDAARPYKKAVGFEFSYNGTVAFDDEAYAEGSSENLVISSGVFDSASTASIILGAHSGYDLTETLTTMRLNDVAAAGTTNQLSCYAWYRLDTAFTNGDADAQQSADGVSRRYLISGLSFAVTANATPHHLGLMGVGR